MKNLNMAKKVLAVALSLAMAIPMPLANAGMVAMASDDVATTEAPADATEAPAESTAPEVTEYFCGDVDKNGAVTAEDALAILKHVVKLEEIPADDALALQLADANHDGNITAEDALQALKVTVKLEEAVVCNPVATEEPTEVPTEEPTEVPTEEPTEVPTEEPTEVPTEEPTEVPTEDPTVAPVVSLGMIDFESEASIVEQFVESNSSTVGEATIGEGVTSNVLTLGEAVEIQDEDGNAVAPIGVQVPNYFAGHSELIQTLQDGLRANDAKLSGDLSKLLIYTLGHICVSDAEVAGITYPTPKYTNGLTMSGWVKMPEDANKYDDADTVVWTFSRNTAAAKQGALMLTAGGDIAFTAGSTNNDYKRNAIILRNSGDGALANPGEWVYVTMTFENNDIKVYYNGEQAELTIDPYYTSKPGNNFNRGFGSVYTNIESAYAEDRRANYRDLFINFTTEEIVKIVENGTTAPEDIDKFVFLNSPGELLIDWLVDESTELFIGGNDLTPSWADGRVTLKTVYSSASAGVQVDDITFAASAMTAEQVAEAYATATAHASGYVKPVDEVVHFEDNRYVTDMYSYANGSKIESVEIAEGVTGNVLTLGAPVTDEENGILPIGVEIENGFAGHYELTQTVGEAIANGGTPLAGNLVPAFSYNAAGNPKWTFIANNYKQITSWPKAVYTNGLTLSAWAKMPETATEEDANAVILSFSKYSPASGAGALVVTAGGKVAFMEGTTNNNYKRNAVVFLNEGQDLIAEAGEWVYITLTIKNDEMKLYYNGVEATSTIAKNYLGDSNNAKTFNKGFGVVGYQDPASEDYDARRNNYRDILKNFSDEEVRAILAAGTTEGVDVSKFTFNNSDMSLLVDWLVDEETKLYVGGTDVVTSWAGHNSEWKQDAAGNWYDSFVFDSLYKESAEGLQVDDISFAGHCMTADEVTAAYEAATPHATGYVQDVKQKVTFEDNNGIANLYAEFNNSYVEEVTLADGSTTKVVTLGAPVEKDEENGILPVGVEITNPFAGQTEMIQDLAFGLKNNNAAFSGPIGDMLTNDSISTTQFTLDSSVYYEGTVFPTPKYTNGGMVSAWVKLPETATSNTVLFTFSRYTPAAKQGILVVTAGGQIGFIEGSTEDAMKRNAMVWNTVNQKSGETNLIATPGEWAYVTLTVENYGMRLFVNGKELESTLDGSYTSANSKKFNRAFGAVATLNNTTDYTGEDDTRRNFFTRLLWNLTIDQVQAVVQAGTTEGIVDVTTLGYMDNDRMTAVDWLVDDSTTFFLGGNDIRPSWRSNTKYFGRLETMYSASSVGLQFDDISFYASIHDFDAKAAAENAFATATAH